MSNEDFKKLAKEVLPMLDELAGILKSNGVDDKDMAHICVSSEGYVSFKMGQTYHEICRLEAGEHARIQYCEEVD